MTIRYCVADDVHFFRELIKHTLKGLNAVCVGESSDGLETVEMVRKMKPDLLILDLVMPLRNGIDVLADIRKSNKELKILVCSTVDLELYIKKAYDMGCDDYLTKPFKKESLMKALLEMFPSHAEALNE